MNHHASSEPRYAASPQDGVEIRQDGHRSVYVMTSGPEPNRDPDRGAVFRLQLHRLDHHARNAAVPS